VTKPGVVSLAFASLFAIGFITLQLAAVEATERAVESRPDADSIVEYDNTRMPMKHFILEYLVPKQANWWQRPFYKLQRDTRWAFLYVLGAFAGVIAAALLPLAGIQKRQTREYIPAKLALGFFAGGLLWLMARFGGPVVITLFLSDAVKDLKGNQLYPALVTFSVLAGLFLNVFFERLKSRFEDSMKN
jgi:hypothetical protein